MQQLPTQKPEPNTKTKNMDLPKMPHNTQQGCECSKKHTQQRIRRFNHLVNRRFFGDSLLQLCLALAAIKWESNDDKLIKYEYLLII